MVKHLHYACTSIDRKKCARGEICSLSCFVLTPPLLFSQKGIGGLPAVGPSRQNSITSHSKQNSQTTVCHSKRLSDSRLCLSQQANYKNFGSASLCVRHQVFLLCRIGSSGGLEKVGSKFDESMSPISFLTLPFQLQ